MSNYTKVSETSDSLQPIEEQNEYQSVFLNKKVKPVKDFVGKLG